MAEILQRWHYYLSKNENKLLDAQRFIQQRTEEYDLQTFEEKNKVLSLGGLYVLGTERHESRRIDNQLRGRSGRQGDPGHTSPDISLEDDLMRRFQGERIHIDAMKDYIYLMKKE